MIKLPFDCHCSELKINPKNWQMNKSSIKQNWFIYIDFMTPPAKCTHIVIHFQFSIFDFIFLIFPSLKWREVGMYCPNDNLVCI